MRNLIVVLAISLIANVAYGAVTTAAIDRGRTDVEVNDPLRVINNIIEVYGYSPGQDMNVGLSTPGHVIQNINGIAGNGPTEVNIVTNDGDNNTVQIICPPEWPNLDGYLTTGYSSGTHMKAAGPNEIVLSGGALATDVNADVLLDNKGYVATANTDTARGVALMAAVTNWKDGQTLRMTRDANYNIGNHQIIEPNNSSFYGSGLNTHLISDFNGTNSTDHTIMIVKAGNNSETAYMTIVGSTSYNMAALYQGLWGGDFISSLNGAVLHDVNMWGSSDCVYFSDINNLTFHIYNVWANSKWDVFALYSDFNAVGYVENCHFDTNDPNGVWTFGSNVGRQRGIDVIASGNVFLRNSMMHSFNTNGTSTTGAIGVYVGTPNCNVFLYGCEVNTIGPYSYNLFSHLGGNIFVDSATIYDTTKVLMASPGHLYYLPSYGNLELAGLASISGYGPVRRDSNGVYNTDANNYATRLAVDGDIIADTNTPTGATIKTWSIRDGNGTIIGYVPIYGAKP